MRVGLPDEAVPVLALGIGLVLLGVARRLGNIAARRGFVVGCAGLAAALSAGYVAHYLRGGPRIVDATSYFLEARGISEGLLSWRVEGPPASTLGRFLVQSGPPGALRAAVVFPPGYPAVLSLGFLAGAPMAVGPWLALLLVFATAWLAKKALAPGDAWGDARGRGLARAAVASAAIASALSASLRYHTADTMSHGLSALCFAASLAFAFEASDALAASRPARACLAALASGLALGLLAASRPASALALSALLAPALLVGGSSRRGRAALALVALVGALPGIALFLAHQAAATGGAGSSHLAYYAQSDGPPGCFRYGFGKGIGCLVEHGDFVASRLPNGFGLLEALGTTGRRLLMHLTDATNAPLLALLALAFLLPRRALSRLGLPVSGRLRLLSLGLLAQVLAYAPFYFDGNYPGGGARLYADVLPLEHAAIGVAFTGLSARLAARRPEKAATAAPLRLAALFLVGFAFFAAHEHASLRDREGGRPMFEPAHAARALESARAEGKGSALVFVDTDHGFSLGFDPGLPPGAPGLHVARRRRDAHDLWAFEHHGRPPVFEYAHDFEGGAPSLSRIDPALLRGDVLEAESLWPARHQEAGFARVAYAFGTCASSGRLLALEASGKGRASATFVLPARELAGRRVVPRVATAGGGQGALEVAADGALLASRPFGASSPGPGGEDGAGIACEELPALEVPEGARGFTITLSRSPSRRGEEGGGVLVALDALRLEGGMLSR